MVQVYNEATKTFDQVHYSKVPQQRRKAQERRRAGQEYIKYLVILEKKQKGKFPDRNPVEA